MIRLTWNYHGNQYDMVLTEASTMQLQDYHFLVDSQERVTLALGGETERHQQKNVIALDVVCGEHLSSARWCGTLIIERKN